jgi:gliding motility-associated-like protein
MRLFMKRLGLKILLLSACLITSNVLSGQCSFTVDVVLEKESDCESNGIIQATLSGINVDNGTIQISDARYSLESVISGGHNKVFDANGGRIQGIPPGTYIVKAEAFCTATNSRVIGIPSQQITVPGTYREFDINQIEVVTAGVKASLKCSPTGLVPIKLGSGRTPYNIRIVEAPDPALIDQSYSHPTEGVKEITDLPHGSYKFEISDACGYIYSIPSVIDSIEPEYVLKEIVPTPKCLFNGKLVLSLTNGTHPYMIVFADFPPEYTGEDTIYVSTEGEYIISGLPKGTYDFKVEESCYSKDFLAEITDDPFGVTFVSEVKSVPCQNNGEVSFKFSGGLPPYIVESVACPNDICPFTSKTIYASDTVIKGFLPGDYEFKISDQCGETIFLPSVTVDTLDMSLSVSDVKDVTTCFKNDGKATININGQANPLTDTLINRTTNTGYPIPSSGPPFKFDTLAIGDYVYKVIDACGREDSVLFVLERDELDALLGEVYVSFGCSFANGSAMIHIIRGVAPYILTIEKDDGSYSDVLGPSDTTVYIFQGLGAGTYNVKIVDACGDIVELPLEIELFDIDDPEYIPGDAVPASLYSQFFSPITTNSDCDKVFIIRSKENNTDVNKYWKERYEDFEVAFIPPGSTFPPAPGDWRDVKDLGDTVMINVDFCEARKNGLQYTVYARHKWMPGPIAACDLLKDVIEFPPVISSASISANRCENFDITIHNESGVICLPYNIIITDTLNGNIVASYRYSAHSDTTITLPLGGYEIKLTDQETDESCTWYVDTLTASVPPPVNYPYVEQYIGQSCDKYQAIFELNYFCYPYSWILREKDTQNIIDSGDIENQEQHDLPQDYRYQKDLLYGVYYELCTLWQGEVMLCSDIYQDHRPPSTAYRMDQATNYCLPDTATGYIRIFRDGETFEKGAVITYISGPSPLKDTVYVVPTMNITEYYPFSLLDSLSYEYVDINEGTYEFSILDSCGITNTISFEYKKSWAEFSYTSIGGCQGLDVFPHGSIYLGNDRVDTWFRIIETPEGVASFDVDVQEGGSFRITETGHYVLQISRGSGIYSCPYDTLSVDFVKKTLALDADATVTYVCDESSDGYIKVRQKGGMGPFTFELFDQGVSQEKNSTGQFNYGRYGEIYQVRITDEGCQVAFPVDVYMLDLSKARLINYDQKVCIGEEIQLMCLSVGSYSGYNWTGPDGLLFSTDQNPLIPSATIADTGIYSITVQPEGCTKIISQEVRIDVIDPEPLADTIIYYCIGDPAVPLDASPTDGNYLKWFDTDTVFTATPPTPPTNLPDTIVYFMNQVDIIYGCEGEKSTFTVIVQAFPDTVAVAYANDICKNDSALITIPDTYPDYIYRIYDGLNNVVGLDTARSDTLLIQTFGATANSTEFYVEVETKHRCVSTERSKVPVTVFHPASPLTYDTLYCIDNIAIPLRADSTEGHRLQWYDTDGLSPLPEAPVPATGVAGSFTYWVAQVDTLRGCEGDKSPLTIEIIALPDILIDASATDICYETSPVVVIGNANNLYTYIVFNDDNDTIMSAVANNSPFNLNLSNYIMYQNDTLFVEIQDTHKCTSKDRAVVPVSVVISGIPIGYDTMYCMNATALPIRAIADSGYYIQWHDLNGNSSASAPVPPTYRADTLYYNVTQKHNILNCESEMIRIQVIIEALPDTVKAYSPPVCIAQYPVIVIPETKDGYLYKIFSESGTLLETLHGADDTLKVTLADPIYQSATFFVETFNPNNCSSGDRTTVHTEVLNYLYLMPDAIPQYQRNQYYSYQLESNAVSPYIYSTDDMLPFGFNLNIDGLISGEPPKNGLIDPVPFLVTLVDANGCVIEKKYVLESDMFIPQVFTPNGDGKNDFFMKGRRLVIFDRLGLKVYEGNDGWDGNRFDGTPAPPDTYFYLIYYEDENLMTEGRKKGYITLMRK